MISKLRGSASIGDADVVPITRKQMTKKPKQELYPIVKVEEYKAGKVEKTYYLVRLPDGTEIYKDTYSEAEEFQRNPTI